MSLLPQQRSSISGLNNAESVIRLWGRPWVRVPIFLGLLVLIFVPRLVGLTNSINPDAFQWLARSSAFYGALHKLELKRSAVARGKRPFIRVVAPVMVSLICASSASETLRLHPYYQSFRSGIRSRDFYGWGEGLEKVAQHLNSKDNAGELMAALSYHRVLGHYFEGSTVRLDEMTADVDCVVLYNSQVGRNLYADVTAKYRAEGAEGPEYVAIINGIEYAWVYRARP